jgi:hypothetical protein
MVYTSDSVMVCEVDKLGGICLIFFFKGEENQGVKELRGEGNWEDQRDSAVIPSRAG